jgi:hypothetical protein
MLAGDVACSVFTSSIQPSQSFLSAASALVSGAAATKEHGGCREDDSEFLHRYPQNVLTLREESENFAIGTGRVNGIFVTTGANPPKGERCCFRTHWSPTAGMGDWRGGVGHYGR